MGRLQGTLRCLPAMIVPVGSRRCFPMATAGRSQQGDPCFIIEEFEAEGGTGLAQGHSTGSTERVAGVHMGLPGSALLHNTSCLLF